MKINFSFYLFLFVVSFNSFNISYIVIPFNTHIKEKENQNEEFNIDNFFQNYFDSQIYIKMNIGTPKKIVPIDLQMNSHGLIIGYLNNNNLKNEDSTYDINKTSSFYGDTKSKKYYSSEYPWGYIGKDIIYSYSNINMNPKDEIKLINISFLYIPKDSENQKGKICGLLGLTIKGFYYVTEEVGFIKTLKELNYINKYNFIFHFTSDTAGFLVLGEEPHNYLPDIYDINNLRKTNVLSDGYSIYGWKIEFTQIYYYLNDGNKQKISETKTALFYIENNYIIGSRNYKVSIEENFFNKYLENNICRYETDKKSKYEVIICDKNSFDINSFPTLFLYHRIFNYTFKLTKEDLFMEKNNKYIFLIMFSTYGNNYFTLGKIFLKKYLFIFNSDTKTIGFYNKNFENEFEGKEIKESVSSKNKIIGIVIILLACVIGFFLAKKLYENVRKRRLNEINEQYEYKSHETDNINYDNKDDKKSFIEIPFKT